MGVRFFVTSLVLLLFAAAGLIMANRDMIIFGDPVQGVDVKWIGVTIGCVFLWCATGTVAMIYLVSSVIEGIGRRK